MASSPLADRQGHGADGDLHGRRTYHPAHQFDTMEQQKESSTLGMWLFLVTEIMFFGGLFTTYVVYRNMYPDAFAAASSTLSVKWGTLNTGVLIGSSLTMVLAIWAAQVNRPKWIVRWLLITMALGSVFLGVKAVEYHDKFVENHVPGNILNAPFNFVLEDAKETKELAAKDPLYQQHTSIFFALYFIMTGLHATHMIIGIAVLAVLVFFSKRGKFDSEYFNPLEMTGLYWHFVDIIWIFLFPLLYLLGAHTHG
ncbi:MAG TPA: cytochrome c oxidase subunit 3 family protein [Thermoanaerobaculia bacterium]